MSVGPCEVSARAGTGGRRGGALGADARERRERGAAWRALVAALVVFALLPTCMAVAVACTDATPVAEVEWRKERDRWYQLRLDDRPCGWMNSQEWRSEDGSQRRSVQESRVRFGRAGSEIEVTVRVLFDESTRGDPILAEVRQRSGQEPIEQTYRFDPADRSRVRVVSRQGGREVESVQELPKDAWLTPMAAEAFAAARRRAGAKSFRVLTVDPASGMKSVEISATLDEAATVAIDGRDIPVTRWKVSNSLLQVPTTEEWSNDDVLMRSSSVMPIGRLDAVLSNRAEALGSMKGPAVELMVRTLVKPDGRMPEVERVGTARFRVGVLEGAMPELPSIGAQRVTRESPSVLLVEVDDARTSEATEEERAAERFRRASVAADSDDPAIRELAERSLRDLRDAAVLDRAEALRRAVHRHIRRKDMGSAFASASETVRSREGDCTEHAVLLAALLRADGIPSRVITGLVYCREFAGERDVFGWHMWTQALIDGRWVDLDATLPDATRHHAGHIITGSSALEQGALDAEWTALVNLIGNLRIQVLETARRERALAR